MIGVGVAVASAAVAQEKFYGAYRLDMQPARVIVAQSWFYGDDYSANCRDPSPACRRKAYVRRGDVVMIGDRRGPYVKASYGHGDRYMTDGWLLRADLSPLTVAKPTPADWLGDWSRDDEATIEIRRGKRPGSLRFEGDALWGSHDPGRVERGAVHVGELREEAVPVAGRVSLGSGDEDDCRVRMRLTGPYLTMVDNNRCGGQNVSFTGLYRRAEKGKR